MENIDIKNDFYTSKTFKKIKHLVYADLNNFSFLRIFLIKIGFLFSKQKIAKLEKTIKFNNSSLNKINAYFTNDNINDKILEYYNIYIKPNYSILNPSKENILYVLCVTILTVFFSNITNDIYNFIKQLILI